MAASNIRIQFIFADNCGNCTNYKAGGNFTAVKNELEDAGFIVGVTELKRMSDVGAVIKSKAILKLATWFPQVFIIAQDLYERIDEFPINDVLQSIALPNGSIVKSASGFEVKSPPGFQLKLGAAYLKEQARNYESGPAYTKAMSLTKGKAQSGQAPQTPSASAPGAPEPDDDLIKGGFFFPTAQVSPTSGITKYTPPSSAPSADAPTSSIKEVSSACMKSTPRRHQRYH